MLSKDIEMAGKTNEYSGQK